MAVSIVIFTGKQKEAKATVCEANRTSLKHHLAVDYMGGDLESLTDEAFDEYIKVDEAVCPSGGTYSFTGSFESGFQIKCSYHDGDGSSGGGDNDPKKVIDNLVDAVKDIIGKTGFGGNREIVEAFFGNNKEYDWKDEYAKFAKDVNMTDIFNGVDLDELAHRIKQANVNGDIDSIRKSLETYKSKSYKIVPYYSQDGKTVIPYYVTKKDYDSMKKGAEKEPYHKSTSTCYVNGNWYFSTKIHDSSSNISAVYMPSVNSALKDVKAKKISTEEAMENHGWIKLK